MSDPRKVLLDLIDNITEPIEEAIKDYCRQLGHEVVPDQCEKPEHDFCVYCGEKCPRP